MVFLSDSLEDADIRSAVVSGDWLTGPAELTADAAAAAAAAKKGDGAAPPAKAAKPAADGPFTLNIPNLCMAAACTKGGLDAIRIFSISASCNRFDFALRF